MTDGEDGTSTSIPIRRKTSRSFARRAKLITDEYATDTKKVRERAIKQLQELADEAHKRATNKYQSIESRQQWAKIEVYVIQTLNSLIKSYDQQKIMEKMEDLTARVEKLMEEDEGPRG